MPRVTLPFARRVRRCALPLLRAACLLIFCVSVVAIPQARVRLVESLSAELLPEDAGSSQQEESESQIVADRASQSRWRLTVLPLPAGSTSSPACRTSYPVNQELAGWQSFAEKVRPLRC